MLLCRELPHNLGEGSEVVVSDIVLEELVEFLHPQTHNVEALVHPRLHLGEYCLEFLLAVLEIINDQFLSSLEGDVESLFEGVDLGGGVVEAGVGGVVLDLFQDLLELLCDVTEVRALLLPVLGLFAADVADEAVVDAGCLQADSGEGVLVVIDASQSQYLRYE